MFVEICQKPEDHFLNISNLNNCEYQQNKFKAKINANNENDIYNFAVENK